MVIKHLDLLHFLSLFFSVPLHSPMTQHQVQPRALLTAAIAAGSAVYGQGRRRRRGRFPSSSWRAMLFRRRFRFLLHEQAGKETFSWGFISGSNNIKGRFSDDFYLECPARNLEREKAKLVPSESERPFSCCPEQTPAPSMFSSLVAFCMCQRGEGGIINVISSLVII